MGEKFEVPKDPKQLREFILKKRKFLNSTDKRGTIEKTKTIFNSLYSLEEYKKAINVLAYFGKVESGELNTSSLLTKILDDKKNLYLPRCVDNSNTLKIYKITDISLDLELGSYGLMEPKKELSLNDNSNIDISQMDIVIVPGLVFDEKGMRYGYGKGYYDSLLDENLPPIKIAMTYDFGIVPFELKKKKHDVIMDIIISENRIILV